MAMTRVEQFRALHVPGNPLVLPNAWDVASARLIAEAGAKAVATTSAGVAWSLGAPDGDALGRDRAAELVARIVEAVDVPVTADIEGGYEDVAETIDAVIRAGAVGVNLEDADRSIAEQVERIAAARQAAADRLFINARIDAFLLHKPEPLKDALTRAEAFNQADGIFVPGVTDLSVVETLVREIGKPLNILAGPGAPPIRELAARGVARVSLGSSIAAAAYAVARRAAKEALTDGTYGSLADGLGYGELNALMG
jgi:2-methylisocitrate lyase-like PEP mutase family enzyme